MSKIEKLEASVWALYAEKRPERDEWCDWLSENHVGVVADNAEELAKRFGGGPDLARAGGLLHDIADTRMKRADPTHEAVSLKMARELMQAADFTADEIALVVDDAIRLHGCHDGQAPSSPEGYALSTADALAHLQTDYYVFTPWIMGKDNRELPKIKQWALAKLDRDFNDKIRFPVVKDECRADYEALKTLFSR